MEEINRANGTCPSNVMNAIVIDTETVLTKLTKINVNKSAGPDGIFPRVLYEAKDVLAYPLKLLFDASLRLKKLPGDWRTANIVPVFKKGRQKTSFKLQTNQLN